jgi:hypothetical protein
MPIAVETWYFICASVQPCNLAIAAGMPSRRAIKLASAVMMRL